MESVYVKGMEHYFLFLKVENVEKGELICKQSLSNLVQVFIVYSQVQLIASTSPRPNTLQGHFF